MIHTVTFWLPFPPSTNRLWRSVRGRVILNPDYKQWQAAAMEAFHVLQRLTGYPVIGAHELELKLSDRFAKRGDADNRLKAVLDIAKKLHIIVDDKFCRRASVEWAVIDHDCLVTLMGEVAFADQWEFAQHLATQSFKRKAKIVRDRSVG